MSIKKKSIISIVVLCIITIVLFGGVKLWINSLKSEEKILEIKQIINEYLQKTYSDKQFQIIDGPNKNLAFGKYNIKLQEKNNKSITIIIDDNLNFLDDSIQNEGFSDKLNSYLKERFDKKFEYINGKVLANINIKDMYSSRKDTVYIDIIDEKKITKREFADITDEILNWLNSNDFDLNLLYLDYKHKQTSDYVYSIKIDRDNMIKKDFIPYIETISKK